MPVKLLSVPDLHLLNSSSLPVTLITMKTNSSLSRSAPFFTRVFPDKINFQSLSSSNNLGFPKLMTTPQPQLHVSTKVSNHGSEIRAAKSLIEDESEVSDWFSESNSSSFKKRQVYGESDDGGNDRRSSDRGGRGGGGSGMNRRSDDYNGGYRGGGNRGSFGGSSRGGGNRGSFSGSSSGGGNRGSFSGSSRGGGSRGSFSGSSRGGGNRGSFSGSSRGGGNRSSYSDNPREGSLRSSFGSSSRGNGRFGGEYGNRDEAYGSRRENRFENGRGRGTERRNEGLSRDLTRGKGTWGSFDSFPTGKEPYVRDTDREDDDRFVSNRRDDRFNSNGRGRGGGVRTGVQSMGRGSLIISDDEKEEDVDDDFEDDSEDDDDDDDILANIHSIPASLPRVPSDTNESYLSETTFDECSVSPASLKGIKDAGYVNMTIVQEATLPVILKVNFHTVLCNCFSSSSSSSSSSSGKDVLAKARTGTGKTVAFLLPSIEVVVKMAAVNRDQKWPPIVVLVICPTRELACQAAMEANKLLKYHPSVGVQVVIGGTRLATEQRRIQANPCQILVATPGRLKDHIMNTPGFATRIQGVKVLVLDEADHLLDMGFRKDIETIISAVPKQRQTLLFSATVPPEVRQICHIALKKDHEYINTVEEGGEETHTQVQQKYLIAPLENQFSLLYALLKDHISNDGDYKVLVFCTTAMVTKLVADLLNQLKLNVREIHSRKSQSYRTQVSDEFRRSKGLILVTSDVSARGVDYPDVTLVIQVGLPSDKAQYIHRLGRTGRKGKEGEGILLLAPWEQFFLSTLGDLPISNADPPSVSVDPDTKKKVERAMSYVEMKNKESAYQAWLGYYNSNKTVGKDKQRLVELANEFSRSMGLPVPPTISRLVLGKMGLKNVPGLRSK
ncbi:hypothetical protein LXL04_026653 [Taraxacum kok-saghyz]